MPRRSARPASVQMAGWVYHLSNKIPKKTERTRRVVWLLKGDLKGIANGVQVKSEKAFLGFRFETYLDDWRGGWLWTWPVSFFWMNIDEPWWTILSGVVFQWKWPLHGKNAIWGYQPRFVRSSHSGLFWFYMVSIAASQQCWGSIFHWKRIACLNLLEVSMPMSCFIFAWRVPLGTSLITGHLSLPHHRSWRCSLRLASSFYA